MKRFCQEKKIRRFAGTTWRELEQLRPPVGLISTNCSVPCFLKGITGHLSMSDIEAASFISWLNCVLFH